MRERLAKWFLRILEWDRNRRLAYWSEHPDKVREYVKATTSPDSGGDFGEDS